MWYPTEGDSTQLELALGQVEKLRKELDLSYIPKFHPRSAYALRETRRIGGFETCSKMTLKRAKRMGKHMTREASPPHHMLLIQLILLIADRIA
jgi:hypothetical protein